MTGPNAAEQSQEARRMPLHRQSQALPPQTPPQLGVYGSGVSPAERFFDHESAAANIQAQNALRCRMLAQQERQQRLARRQAVRNDRATRGAPTVMTPLQQMSTAGIVYDTQTVAPQQRWAQQEIISHPRQMSSGRINDRINVAQMQFFSQPMHANLGPQSRPSPPPFTFVPVHFPRTPPTTILGSRRLQRHYATHLNEVNAPSLTDLSSGNEGTASSVDCGTEEALTVPTAQPSPVPLQIKSAYASSQPPLKSIRLLKLVPPDWPDSVTSDDQALASYSLETLPYVDHPDYLALSYAWGDEQLTSSILVNGKPVNIRENFSNALTYLRESDPGMYLWADAICINQEDDREKSQLVQHMGEIFANASKVYAWLGPNEHATDETSSDGLLLHLSDLAALFWKHAGPMRSGKLNEHSLELDQILAGCLSDVHSKFESPPSQGGFPTGEYSAFSARPFWQRIWVLQEVYLAKDLHFICGRRRMLSKDLAGALILLETFQKHLISTHQLSRGVVEINPHLHEFAYGFPSFPEMHRLIVYTSIYPPDVISLRIAMTNFCVKELPRGSRSTDPRDMIYGLLGFATTSERSYIKADYSLDAQKTYTAVTRSMIENGFTDILAWSQPETKVTANLPSWVPDFSATIYESLCSQGQAKAWLPKFNACGTTHLPSKTPGPPHDAILCVHGRHIDNIARIGTVWSPRARVDFPSSSVRAAETMHSRSATYDELLAFLSEIQDLCSHAQKLAVDSSNSSRDTGLKPPSHEDSAWRVPCTDQIVLESRLVRGEPSTRSRYEATLRGLQECVNKRSRDLPSESRPYVEALLRWVNKRAFVTEKGFVGLGPESIRPGDKVVTLGGFSACYVLRTTGQDVDMPGALGQHSLVGEAYVDGLMDGELAQSTCEADELFCLG
ncbi:Uu.00g055850.m01.CDS01 [Anthostomella pinea]|uniref:Uu.00g055850.m01.CDS01 n=1 Tax=Anthostomella pinea TaxID=933095 RepID=A0AAI8VXT0_9PEZI|nr:Uu.00g055850.m01.CDS01 [Anthostomella pinea]